MRVLKLDHRFRFLSIRSNFLATDCDRDKRPGNAAKAAKSVRDYLTSTVS